MKNIFRSFFIIVILSLLGFIVADLLNHNGITYDSFIGQVLRLHNNDPYNVGNDIMLNPDYRAAHTETLTEFRSVAFPLAGFVFGLIIVIKDYLANKK